MIAEHELLRIMPYAKNRVAAFLAPLNDAMYEFSIDTPKREAHFLAQIAHESGELRYVRELASGEAYEGRKDLGNVETGDGVRFKGRGLIQVTGRANYQKCGDALGLDLLLSPELLEEPANACRSAGWFWKSRGLNELADKGDASSITRRINGGLNGYASRLEYLNRAREVLEI